MLEFIAGILIGFVACLVTVNLEGPRRWITEYEERIRDTDV